MKNLVLENYSLEELSYDDQKKIDGGIFGVDDAVFWTVAAGVAAVVTLADYAAKEIQTGYEIYQKQHKK